VWRCTLPAFPTCPAWPCRRLEKRIYIPLPQLGDRVALLKLCLKVWGVVGGAQDSVWATLFADELEPVPGMAQ